METPINPDFTVGFGLASGTGDQRSANQTMGGDFTRKNIWIDYAYAKYNPAAAKWLSVIGGRFVNPFWQPSDMLICGDINLEGGAMRLEKQVIPSLGLFFNGGAFVLEDRTSPVTTISGNTLSGTTSTTTASYADPIMYVAQIGAKYNFTKESFFRFAPAYYNVSNLKRTPVIISGDPWIGPGFSSSGTNTAWSGGALNGKYRYSYNVINWGGEFGFDRPFGISAIPYFGIMGGYVKNPDPSSNGHGYLAGFTMGYPDIKNGCEWALEYTFRRLEKDAWLDFMPDSNFYSGNTNVMGHRVKLLVGLMKNTALGVTYYDTWKVRNTTSGLVGNPSEEQYIQADLLFRF